MSSALTLELLEWVAAGPRTYEDAMEAWRSNCPRHSVWDDACSDGLIQVVRSHVSLTALGEAALGAHRREEVAGRTPKAQAGIPQDAKA